MAEGGGVEPHTLSRDPVFKAGRRTISAASPSNISYKLYKSCPETPVVCCDPYGPSRQHVITYKGATQVCQHQKSAGNSF